MWLTGNVIADTLSKMGAYGLEFTHRRYYSKYKGTVKVNNDPQQQGRVQVAVGDVGHLQITASGATPETLELYAYPSSPYAGNNYGFYFPPEVGDSVWVWFEYGDPTQPHISGGWWKNPGAAPVASSTNTFNAFGNETSKPPSPSTQKPPVTSQLPVEFNSNLNGTINTNSGTPSLFPTTRGIKSKRGHGILFEDEALPGSQTSFLGRDTGVTLWTGAAPQTPEVQPGQASPPPMQANRHHSIVMSDRDQEIHITTFGPGPTQRGHETVWDDYEPSQGIRTTSIYGHQINIDDVTKSITVTTKLGHKLVLSDTLNSITASTVLGNVLTLSDTLKIASIVTPLKQSMTMNDKTLTTSIATPGSVMINATGAATVNAGAAATVSAVGALAISGTGVSVTSTSGGPSVTIASGVSLNTFTGLVTENYNGALTQIVIGAWNITASTATIVSNLLVLGSLTNTKFYLVTDAFIDAFNLHTHGIPAPGVSTVTAPPTTSLVKAAFVTSDVRAS